MKNNNPVIKPHSKLLMITAISIALSGCTSTDALYAEYDENCEIPQPKVKIVERVKIVEKVKIKKEVIVKYKTKYKTKVVTKVVNKVDRQVIRGIRWEPAVYFGFDLATLTKAEQKRLDADVSVLRRHKHLKLNIQSFTDFKGSNAYNRRLAVRRQNTVIHYLVGHGIAKQRIRVSPLGEELPILGQSVQERSINRRVELMLLDQKGRPLALEIQPKQSKFNPPGPVR
ncbi:MAG: OmpA family protein [Cocleimonas sp.]|nr:OmpA family protein [Cocleimonas sp.]